MDIRIDDPSRAAVRALLEEHLADMHALTPPGSVHALDVDGLSAPGVTFWSAWSGDELTGCAALLELDPVSAEIKSMRTALSWRRRGVASRLLRHLLEEGRRRGYERIYLETGSTERFAAARALYASHGFEACGPFAGYVEDPHSAFMRLDIGGPDRDGSSGAMGG